MDNIPRRIQMEKMTQEEKDILELIGRVEELGAHPDLTNCVLMLSEAKEYLGHWVDAQLEEAEASNEA